MKQLLFTMVFFSVSAFAFAQLDMVKEKGEKKPSKSGKTIKPKPINTASYIIVYRGDQLASALNNYSIYIDGIKVCILSNGRFLKYPVSPGNHEIEATKSGIVLKKKETFTSVISTSGRNNYVVCNIKKSLLHEKVEMNEVGESSGRQTINNLKEDNCQEEINNRQHKH